MSAVNISDGASPGFRQRMAELLLADGIVPGHRLGLALARRLAARREADEPQRRIGARS